MDGNPQIILFDVGSAAWQMDSYKQQLWDTTSIGIPHLDVEANDAVILGFMVAQFITEVSWSSIPVLILLMENYFLLLFSF